MTHSVTQADRDAAAKWAKSNSRHAQAANIRRGACDSAPIVQAFAQHAARAAESMREEAAKVCDGIVRQFDRHSRDGESCAFYDATEACAEAIRAIPIPGDDHA